MKPKPKVVEKVQKAGSGDVQVEYGNSGSDTSDQEQRLSFEERLEVQLNLKSKGAPIAWRVGRDVWRCAYCDWELTGKSCFVRSCPGSKMVSKRAAQRKVSDKLPIKYGKSLPKPQREVDSTYLW